eukprot:GILJ01016537.1.p1 GENE.GILJ01016537.1~~GILJ01016537.1.p1  ORF type:complete len:388 (-),score=51.71 GILJ01016537.1:76-1239(-)
MQSLESLGHDGANNGFHVGSHLGSTVDSNIDSNINSNLNSSMGSNVGFHNGFVNGTLSSSAAAGAGAHPLQNTQRLLTSGDPKLIAELYSTDLWDEDGHLRFTGEYPPISNHHSHVHSAHSGLRNGSYIENESYNNGSYSGSHNGSHFLQTPNRSNMVHSSGSIPTRSKSPLGSRDRDAVREIETVTPKSQKQKKRQVKVNQNLFSVQSVFGHPSSSISSYTGPGARSGYHPRALRPFATSMKGSVTSYTAEDFIHREDPLVSIAPEKPVEMSRYNGDIHMRSTENLMRSLRLPQPMRNSLALWNSPSAPRLSSLANSKSPLRSPSHSVAVQVSFDDNDSSNSSGNRFMNRSSRHDEQRTRLRTDPRHIVAASVYHSSSTPVLPRFN